jgi:uncharacterized protein YpmS
VFRLLRGCFTLVGLLVAAAVAVVVYRTFTQPQPAAVASPVPAANRAAAGNLDARLASAEATIRQNAAQGRHAQVSFTVPDPELTARVNQAIAQGQVSAPVSNVAVNTVPGQVKIAGQVKTAVASIPFTMTAVPKVNAGKAQLDVTGIDFGGLPVPQPLASQLTGAVGTDNLLGDVPLTVTSFRAERGQLVLEGTT